MSNILVVEDEKEIADLVEIYLKNENFNVYKYYRSEEALEQLETLKIDLAILDVMMPVIDGFQLVQKIREKIITFPLFLLPLK